MNRILATTVTEIRELERLASPAPYPQGLAVDGTTLWIGSCESHRLYAVDIGNWSVRDEALAPGEPFGIAVLRNELRVILGFGDDADDRYIYRFTPGHGFDDSGIACPDLSGAYLAWDGKRLFLSQAWKKKILTLDGAGNVEHETSLDRRPVGMTAANGCLYVVTTDEDWENRELTKFDIVDQKPTMTAVAAIPFAARGLAFDGSRFWTTDRQNSEIVAFTHNAGTSS